MLFLVTSDSNRSTPGSWTVLWIKLAIPIVHTDIIMVISESVGSVAFIIPPLSFLK